MGAIQFTGECNLKRMDKVKAILDTVTFQPFEVVIERLGTFSHGTLCWAGLREDKPLMDLQHEIESKLTLCSLKWTDAGTTPTLRLGAK